MTRKTKSSQVYSQFSAKHAGGKDSASLFALFGIIISVWGN